MDPNSAVLPILSRATEKCVSVDELLLYTCDLSLAVLSGLTLALFNLIIGEYLTVSVAHNGHPEQFPLVQCIIHFLTAGSAAFLLAFLHHVSINTDVDTARPKLSTHYRRNFGVFVRDLVFLAASIAIAFSRSWRLTTPVLLVPILVTAWTTLFEKQNTPIVRALFLAGPTSLFFLALSLGGLYGTYLVDLRLLDQPGDIFTIVAGIGSGAVQFSKARAQFQFQKQQDPQQKNLEKPECGKKDTNGHQSTNGTTIADGKQERANKEQTPPKMCQYFCQAIAIWARIQLRLLKRWPFLCALGLVTCVSHSLGYPTFTRLGGLFFDVFEDKMGEENGSSSSLISHVRWICVAYAVLALAVFIGSTTWFVLYPNKLVGDTFPQSKNAAFGRMGIKFREELQEETENEKVEWTQIELTPLITAELFYGLFCILFAISSSIQNNRPVGALAVGVFCLQVLFQHLACKHFTGNKYGRAICFASTNGMPYFSQALAYAGGFIFVQFGFVSALNVFKIIQTMHLGSLGVSSSIVLMTNDFCKRSTELRKVVQGAKKNKSVAATNAL